MKSNLLFRIYPVLFDLALIINKYLVPLNLPECDNPYNLRIYDVEKYYLCNDEFSHIINRYLNGMKYLIVYNDRYCGFHSNLQGTLKFINGYIHDGVISEF